MSGSKTLSWKSTIELSNMYAALLGPMPKGPSGVTHIGSSAPVILKSKVLSSFKKPFFALRTNVNTVSFGTSNGVPSNDLSSIRSPGGSVPLRISTLSTVADTGRGID